MMNFKAGPRLLLGLGLVAAWLPQSWDLFRDNDRNDQRFWHIGWVLDHEAKPEDLVLVHSIPSGVVGVARYTQAPVPIAGWVQQLGARRVPESIEALVAGVQRVFFIEVHTVGSAKPEEAWLRKHFRVAREEKISSARLTVFERP